MGEDRRDIWQKAFTFVLLKKIFPLPCAVKQENSYYNAVFKCNLQYGLSLFTVVVDNLKLSLFPQKCNNKIKAKRAIPLLNTWQNFPISMVNFSNFFCVCIRRTASKRADICVLISGSAVEWHKKKDSSDCRYKW